MLERDWTALGRRFDRWFPLPAASELPLPDPGPDADDLRLLLVLLASCQIQQSHDTNLGSPPTADTNVDPIVHGQDGQVDCAVSGMGLFSFDAALKDLGASVELSNGSIGPDGSGTVFIQLFPDDTFWVASAGGYPCTVHVDQGVLAVGPGMIWARFECQRTQNAAQPTSWCAASGVFVLENCSQ